MHRFLFFIYLFFIHGIRSDYDADTMIIERFFSERKDILFDIAIKIDTDIELTLNFIKGSDWKGQLVEFSEKYGLSTEDTGRIQNEVAVRSLRLQKSLNNKYLVVLLTFHEGITCPSSEKINSVLEKMVEAALRHVHESGNLILVANGFSLCSQAVEQLASTLDAAGWHRLVVLQLEEFQGHASAVNLALEFVPEHSIVAIITPNFYLSSLHSSKEGTVFGEYRDVFLAYEHLAFAYGLQGSMVAAVPSIADESSKSVECSIGRLPLIVFDKASWSLVGPWNLRFMFQGAAADWLERARGLRILVQPMEWQTQFFQMTYPRDGKCPQEYGGSIFLDGLEGMPCPQLLKLVQSDLDMFYLQKIYKVNGGRTISKDIQQTMDFCYRMFGLNLSGDLIDRTWKERIKAAAVIVVYDDSRFLLQALDDIMPRVEHVIVLVGTKPWNGPARNNTKTYMQVHDLFAHYRGNEAQEKISLITGSWNSEAEQRNFGNRVAAFLPGNLTHVLVIDTDEMYHPVELERMLIGASRNLNAASFMAEIATYWKSIHMVIDPPEEVYRMLWLIDFKRCWFHEARIVQCNLKTGEERQRAFFARDMGVCHHLSYTRTDEELVNKITSFSHAHEVAFHWLERIWLAWDSQPDMENLHPVAPQAYKKAIKAPLYSMHPSIRKRYFEEARNCTRLGKEKWSPVQKLLCLRKGKNQAMDLCPSFPPSLFDEARQHRDVTKQRKEVLRWEDEENSYVNQLGFDEFMGESFIDVDPKDDIPSCPPRFLILTVCEGKTDTLTEPMFEDTALVIASGLKRIGFDVITKTCFDFRFCLSTGNRIIIVLGVHNLGRYIRKDNDSQIPFLFLTGWHDPEKTILYNFEHAAFEKDFSSEHTLQILKKFPNVWDYSLSNINNLRAMGVSAKHVPLGYVPELSLNSSHQEDIDVLFYGRLNTHRSAVLQALRSNGIQVLHVNAHTSVFGKNLIHLILRSKIVLNLRYFSDEEEWDMTRFLRPLANSKLIVSERSGRSQEASHWKDGVIFVDTVPEMIGVIQECLKMDANERMKTAKRGYEIFENLKEEKTLFWALNDLISYNRCLR